MSWSKPTTSSSLPVKSALADLRADLARALRVGPVVCLRLIVAAVAAVLALAGLAAFALVVLCVLLPVVVVVIASGGLALLAWPFAPRASS